MRPSQIKPLLRLATAFIFLLTLILTFAPSVRERTWAVQLNISQWAGFFIWTASILFAHHQLKRNLPDHDHFLFASASLLTGWGILTIWRLDPAFGWKQSIWLIFIVLIFSAIQKLPHDLAFLRRNKSLLLTVGFFITALTLFFGTSPSGFGPRLWLGCCGIYLQPSEPLKLLLVIYLSAFLADHGPTRFIPMLTPTIFVTSLGLIILLVQRDLGTASIFILLFTVMLFLATGKKRILLVMGGALSVAALIGYFFSSIIQLRLNVWINPWDDPAGSSFQIIQSLLAVANGGTFGRGLGIGNPSLVPVTISDFIFSAIAEETGLVGTVGLISIIYLILARGMLASIRAADSFRRLLAAGLTAYLGVQSILIIGGNLRMLPLTGVTLPFVSYGGSSLMTCFIALGLLLKIGTLKDDDPATLKDTKPYMLISTLLGIGLLSVSLTNAYWAILRGPDLLTRTDNARRSIADRYVLRGTLFDRNGTPLNFTQGESGNYQRTYLYPPISSVTGYTNPVYGQGGIEGSLDEYLRGLIGNPASSIWFNHLLYGTPPTGLDVTLSIDLPTQRRADKLLGAHKGAVILMNAESGEILVMASHPFYDPNNLDLIGESLLVDENAPLVNRAAQGRYPLGEIKNKILQVASNGAETLAESEKRTQLELFGFFSAPELRLPVIYASVKNSDPLITPLQMAVFASALSNNGIRPSPRIALAVDTPQQGRVILPTLTQPIQIFDPLIIAQQLPSLIETTYWVINGDAQRGKESFTWTLMGTPQKWQGIPLAVVVLLEEKNLSFAGYIAEQVLKQAITQK